MKFIDLFAGLGGFHTGFTKSGYECVFACEIDPALIKLYKSNYGIEPHGDITKINAKDIPHHDILCAGFPCQPFSLAGKKRGAECPESGKLIDDVVRITKYHKPKFVILENVPSIITIAEGTFWKYLQEEFKKIGYQLNYKIISPVDIGIPQNRKRIFIVCNRTDVDMSNFSWPSLANALAHPIQLPQILNHKLSHKKLEQPKSKLIAHWQKLLDLASVQSLTTISLVAPEFGATYPNDISDLTLEQIRKYKGAYGQPLSNCRSWASVYELLPNYVIKNKKIPDWMAKSVNFSRKFYSNNADLIDQWKLELPKEFNSWQILEWRGLKNSLNIYEHIVQFRASGIRVLKSDKAPSLIAMTPTQIPIIPSENRYMSKFEAAKLQCLDGLKVLPENTTRAFKALGNAVNAGVVELIAHGLKELHLT